MNLMESTLAKADLDERSSQAILNNIQSDWLNVNMSLPPGRNAGAIYQKLLLETNQEDLFRVHKRTSIQEALKLYPRLKNLFLRQMTR